MARLIDDLLDVSRINSGKIQLRKEVVEPGRRSSTVPSRVGAAAETRRHELTVALPPGAGAAARRPDPAGAGAGRTC